MPVAMATSSESESERTDSNTQELPTIPKAKDKREWNRRKVLDWIQKRLPNILEEVNEEGKFIPRT